MSAQPTTTSRMLRLKCTNEECGGIVRASSLTIAQHPPHCSCGGAYQLEDGTILPRPTLPAVIERNDAKAGINRVLAAVAGGFIPCASWVLAHIEASGNQYLYALVAAALIYSAPTLASWAERWCDGRIKAWAFALLLEGVMIGSGIIWLNLVGLAILAGINSAYAYERAKAR